MGLFSKGSGEVKREGKEKGGRVKREEK